MSYDIKIGTFGDPKKSKGAQLIYLFILNLGGNEFVKLPRN